MNTRKIKSLLGDYPMVWKLAKQGQSWQYELQYARFYGAFSSDVASVTEINLEFCNACNLRCAFCALDHLKPKRYMSIEVLDRVLDSLLFDHRFRRVRTLNLYNGGETLLHPRRLELFTHLQAYKSRFNAMGKPFPKVVLLTNGMLLRKELAHKLIRLEVLDEVGFSLDGGSPEAFEAMRVNAKWEKFAGNVHDFIQEAKRYSASIKTFGICIVPRPHPLNASWMDPAFQEVVNMLDEVEYRRLHDWGGAIELKENKAINKKGCAMLMRQLVVLPDGSVTVCCNDLNQKGVVGNVLQDTLYSIYMGKARLHYVQLLKEGRKEELELCKNCVSF
jgi:sulfatase maturation enzyme AslB (radical SAM superfamily)